MKKGTSYQARVERQKGSAIWKRGAPNGKCCVEKRSEPKVLQEHGMKKQSAKSMLWSTDGD